MNYNAGNQCYQRKAVPQVNLVMPPFGNRELRTTAIKHLVQLSVEHEFFAIFFSKRKTCHEIFFLFVHKNIPYWNSLETLWQGDCSEHMFSWTNKKNYGYPFYLELHCLPYTQQYFRLIKRRGVRWCEGVVYLVTGAFS